MGLFMKIANFIIPKSLQSNDFIKSVHKQFQEKGELSKKQVWVLADVLEIEEDFYEWNHIPTIEEQTYEELKAKLIRNRFRKTKNRNKCIRAMYSIIDEKPDYALINDALGLNFHHYRRW